MSKTTPKKNVFMIAGHGYEELVDFDTKRTRVPANKILVIFPICGRANYMRDGCRVAHTLNMKEHIDALSDPITHKAAIEALFNTKIRVYLPNQLVPRLYTNLFLDFEDAGTVIMKSGVYRAGKIPEINRDILPKIKTVSQKLGTQYCVPFIGLVKEPSDYTQPVHNEVFRGNLYKPALTQGDTITECHDRSFGLNEIMNAVGKGVYYYIGCRKPYPNYDINVYNNIYEKSDEQQINRSHISLNIAKIVDNTKTISVTKSLKKKTPPPPPTTAKPPVRIRQSLNRRHRRKVPIIVA